MPGTVVAEAMLEPQQVTPADENAWEPFLVIKQDVELEINFQQRSIQGRSILTIFPLEDLEEVSIDARQCEIDLDNLTVNGRNVPATYHDPYRLAQTPTGYQWEAAQFHLRKERMQPLTPKRRPDIPAIEREKRGVVPCDGSLRVQLLEEEPEPTSQNTKLKLRVPGAAQDAAAEVQDPRGTHTIVIPFKTTQIRDGLHFVGIDDGDSRYPHVYSRHSIEPGTASCIFPCIDDPGCRSMWKVAIKIPRALGDALQQPLATQHGLSSATNGRQLNNAAPQRTYVMSEEDKLLDMTVICSGLLVGEEVDPDDEHKKIMTFETDLSCAAQHIGFAAGPFEDVDLWSHLRTEEDDEQLGSNAVKIHGYCLPGRSEEVLHTCAAMVKAADYLTPQFGRYPFDSYKLCFVDDMIEDTVPLYSFTLCSNRLLFPEGIVDTDTEVMRTLAQSFATQYFGINIIPNRRSDYWLVIGIAWYMAEIFMKRLCGNNEYRFRQKILVDKLVETDVGRPGLHDLGDCLHLGDFEMDFLKLKGPLALFILDRWLSNASRGKGITRVVSKMIGKANTSSDDSPRILVSEAFRRTCEKLAVCDLEQFWAQYVLGSGCPRFDVAQRFNKKRLVVELVMQQLQSKRKDQHHVIEKDEFWRELQEYQHDVFAYQPKDNFYGPMTIRIHEADGTPYEHRMDLREEMANKPQKFEITYNTKYKRLKRSRRQRDRANAGAAQGEGDGEGREDTLLYCLGDVLQSPEEIESWKLSDWSPEVEKQMDQESYEWIRLDADFEWLTTFKTNFQAYMYVSQLQQDRDVAAQQDSLLFIAQHSQHPLIATFLTRTLLDRRYFYGIRVMAAEMLPRHAGPRLNSLGLVHLMRVFKEFFCFPNSSAPRPNDFSDKRQYLVKCAIALAIARCKNADGKCPREAQQFILDQLRFNDNSSNPYSDHFYIAKLLEALATSLIAGKKTGQEKDTDPRFTTEEDGFQQEPIARDVDMVDAEDEEFLEQALDELERYRRMDEWTASYQNIWTVTVLECKQRLMKTGTIPVSGLEFVEYLQDDTTDLVQIKAFECLVELGLMLKHPYLKLLLSFMSLHPSPFIRDRLFKSFSRGLAAIAFGENKEQDAVAILKREGDILLEQGEDIIEQRQAEHARREDISKALASLKEAVKDNKDFQVAIWQAIESPVLGLAEMRRLLDLCEVVFDPENALMITLRYPTRWFAERGARIPGKQCVIEFRKRYKIKPDRMIEIALPEESVEPVQPQPPPAPVPAPAPLAEPKKPVDGPRKFKIAGNKSFSGPSGAASAPTPTTPATPAVPVTPATPGPSIAVPPAKQRGNSISVKGAQRTALPGFPAPAPTPTPTSAAPVPVPVRQPQEGAKPTPKRPKVSNKRKSDDAEASPRPSKIVKMSYDIGKLRADVRRAFEAAVANSAQKPSRQPGPTGMPPPSSLPSTAVDRSPLPSTPGASTSRPRPVNGASKTARKPLPSSAPSQSSPPAVTQLPASSPPIPQSAALAQPTNGTAPPPPKKILFKIKRASISAPPAGSP